MGYKGLKDVHRDLFSKFLDEWIVWVSSGKNPGDASLDMCYWMDLMEVRLREHRLSCRVDVVRDGRICNVPRVSGGVPFDVRRDLYRVLLFFQKLSRRFEFVRDGSVVYSRSDYVSFYEVIVDCLDVHDGLFVCPN